jgi:hypothetical protein
MIEAQALHGKFTHGLYGLSDRQAAQALYHMLETRHSESGQRRLAQMQLQVTPVSRPEGGVSPRVGLIAWKPSTNDLEHPVSYALRQNYPNPFNPTTMISYDLPIDTKVTLKVYGLLGKEVLTLVAGLVFAGYQHVELDASRLASGVYFYRLTAGSFTAVKKMVLLQ